MESALTITNLTKTYSDFKLNGLNLTLPAGCIMGFIGENGAGKTTTIKLILDLISREEGEILFYGTDIKLGGKQMKEHIGVVLDECYFPENLSAKNINTIMKNTFQTWDEKHFFDYLKRFSLPLTKAVKGYSRGMKAKLSIAVALSHDSKILILDEATNGLDPLVRDEITDLFLEFIQDETHSILISSHIVSDLEKICDYIAFIHKGNLIFCEEKDELLSNYGILKCSKQEFSDLDTSLVKGFRENQFGIEALVKRSHATSHYMIDPASIEDIMLYMGREHK